MRYAKEFRALATGISLPVLAVTVGVAASSATAQPTISMTEWQSRQESLDARMTALNAQIQAVLARCSGSYPVEQLSAMQAQCDQSGTELKALQVPLMKEHDYLIEQKRLIDAQ